MPLFRSRFPLLGVAVVCLAIGMGATAISFSLTDASVLRPFGLPRAEELVVLWESDPARPAELVEISLLDFQDWEQGATAFTALAAFGSSHWPGIGRARGETFAIAPRAVTREFFRTLGRTPILGRDFGGEDMSPAVPAPVILSHHFWMTHFGGAPTVLGESLFIDNEQHRIVGVMPRGFAFPDAPDGWVSAERSLRAAFERDGLSLLQQRAIGVLMAVGRIKPNVTHQQAREQLSQITAAVMREFRPHDASFVAVVTPFTNIVLGRLGGRVWIVLAMTVAVLLFACGNVAALRVAHLTHRLGELAARMCLGASRAALTRGLLLETVPLIGVSAALAVVVALALEAWLHQVPVVAASGIDLAQVRGVTAASMMLSALIAWALVSLLPAVVIARRVTPAEVTLGSKPIMRGSRRPSMVLLVQAAVALCLVAMAGAAFQAFARLAATDVGFATSNVTFADVSVPGWKYQTADARARLDRALVDVLRTIPGTVDSAGVSVRPFRFGEVADGLPVRRPDPVAVEPHAAVAASRVIVTPGYFDTLRIPLLEGRAPQEGDATADVTRIVVSDSLARALWGDRHATGKSLEFFTLTRGWQRGEIIGVAGDIRSRVISAPSLDIYVPHGAGGIPLGSLVVRHTTSHPITETMLRRALQQVDPDVVIERVQGTRSVLDGVLAPTKLLSTAMTMLGATGLVLLALGIFAAAASALRVARREIAIRQAVGATPLAATRAPLGSLFSALAFGTAAGAVLTPAGIALLASMGIADRGSLVASISVAAVAVLAAAGVAVGMNLRRAMTVSPAELLRAD